MSVDKFGHYSHTRAEGERGPPGIGFNLTPDGDYDIKNKHLTNVKDPLKEGDAVTLNHMTKKCLIRTSKSLTVDLQQHKMINVGDGEARSDALTVGQLVTTGVKMFSNIVKDTINYQVAHHNGQQRNAEADSLSDDLKISLDHLIEAQKKLCLKRNGISLNGSSTAYNVGNKRLSHVAYPIHDSDAINMKFLRELLGKEIAALGNITDKYVLSEQLRNEVTRIANERSSAVMQDILSGKKQLTNVLDPKNDYDAINRKYMETYMKKIMDDHEKGVREYLQTLHINERIREEIDRIVGEKLSTVVENALKKQKTHI